MTQHAILSPSGASRWLACPPSALLESKMPYTTSRYADEGTLAHSLGELMIKQKLGLILTKAFKAAVKEIEANDLYAPEMWDHCENFSTYVAEQYNKAKAITPDALIFLETKLDLTAYIPEGFGTADVIIIHDGVLTIIDLKYGKGVPVDAENNNQMMTYALGAVEVYDMLYRIDFVEMTIYQPRIDNISTSTLRKGILMEWGDAVLKPGAELAFNGGGEFNPGESQCRFCKVKATCKALAAKVIELDYYQFKSPALMNIEEIADILKQLPLYEMWAEAVQGYALDKAVNNGVTYPGFKVVEGRSNRKYSDEKQVAGVLINAGLKDEDIYEKSLLGITKMTKLVGTSDFNRLLSDYLIKPPGKPCLVKEDDPRPAYSSADRALDDFKDVDDL